MGVRGIRTLDAKKISNPQPLDGSIFLDVFTEFHPQCKHAMMDRACRAFAITAKVLLCNNLTKPAITPCHSKRCRRAVSAQPGSYFANDTCSLCPVGYYSEEGQTKCQVCPNGYFSTRSGWSTCQSDSQAQPFVKEMPGGNVFQCRGFVEDALPGTTQVRRWEW